MSDLTSQFICLAFVVITAFAGVLIHNICPIFN